MSKYDSLVKKAAFYEKLALYGDRKDFLNAIAQATPTVGGTAEADKYLKDLENSSVQTTSPVTISATPPVSKEIQHMLNQLFAFKQVADMMPIKEDGIYGDETRKAYDLFKRKTGKPPTEKNIREELNKLQSGQVNLEDAAKQQNELAKNPYGSSGLKMNFDL